MWSIWWMGALCNVLGWICLAYGQITSAIILFIATIVFAIIFASTANE